MGDFFFEEALKEAHKAFASGEVPVGAVIVKKGHIIARAYNLKESLKDCTAHAELLAIKSAQDFLGDWRLVGCDLYTTLEPCPMCAGAILHARLDRVFYGAPDLKWGAAGTKINLFEHQLFNHSLDIQYVPCEQSVLLLKDFFKQLREG